jgi:excisionase family DNA binding protein
MPDPTYNPLLDGNELGTRLGVSQSTIERWVAARIIPVYRFGYKCLRFDYSAVREALAKFETPAYRRLPRGPFAHRRKQAIPTQKWVQPELPLRWDDPAQLLLFSREDDGQETSGKVLIQEAA